MKRWTTRARTHLLCIIEIFQCFHLLSSHQMPVGKKKLLIVIHYSKNRCCHSIHIHMLALMLASATLIRSTMTTRRKKPDISIQHNDRCASCWFFFFVIIVIQQKIQEASNLCITNCEFTQEALAPYYITLCVCVCDNFNNANVYVIELNVRVRNSNVLYESTRYRAERHPNNHDKSKWHKTKTNFQLILECLKYTVNSLSHCCSHDYTNCISRMIINP